MEIWASTFKLACLVLAFEAFAWSCLKSCRMVKLFKYGMRVGAQHFIATINPIRAHIWDIIIFIWLPSVIFAFVVINASAMVMLLELWAAFDGFIFVKIKF